MFWDLTIPELEAVVQRKIESDRAAILRAGLIAATILNVHRKKGTALIQAHDFLPEQHEYLSVEEAKEVMDRWAQSQGSVIVEPTDREIAVFGRESA